MEINKLIENFRKYLLSSPLKENIAKIVLFGSYAKRLINIIINEKIEEKLH